MRRIHIVTFLAIFVTAVRLTGATSGAPHNDAVGPATTNNHDSCDIAVMPAATLLLPYFEVDLQASPEKARTTIFTITNVTRRPQIARATIWSDWGYPVLTFNLFLTGYDVQGINLRDVLARGVIGAANGAGNQEPTGERSLANDANPNFAASAASQCAVLPGVIPASVLTEVRSELTTGVSRACGQRSQMGEIHEHAIGYVTVDVVATCGTTLPTDPNYYLSELLYDNVLIGDYQQLNQDLQAGDYASGNPMVHIRAIPEGGAAGSRVDTNLPYTFYDRYTLNAGIGVPRNVDRRQPLPSTFAVRFLHGGVDQFGASLQIWREGVVAGDAKCAAYFQNSILRIAEITLFDEHEFALTDPEADVVPFNTGRANLELPSFYPELPVTSSRSSADPAFPLFNTPSGDDGGWIYLNLNNGGSTNYSVTTNGTSRMSPPTTRDFASNSSTTVGVRQSQNWVTVMLYAGGRYSVGMDALPLENGCTPAPAASFHGGTIGPPAANTNP